jgi:ribosome biogenesis protein MAK21
MVDPNNSTMSKAAAGAVTDNTLNPRRRRRGRKGNETSPQQQVENNNHKQKTTTTTTIGSSHHKNKNNHNHHETRTKSDYKTNDAHNHSSNNKNTKTLYHHHSSLLIQLSDEAPTWFDYGKNLPGRNATIWTDPLSPSQQRTATNSFESIQRFRSMADEILQAEMDLFDKNNNNNNNKNGSSSDQQWIQNTMKHGTLKDRIAAMSVVVSTNPVHKFYALDGLLHMAGCHTSSHSSSSSHHQSSNNNNNNYNNKTTTESSNNTNSRVAQMAAEAMEELFLTTLLPPDRKLVSLDHRPLYKYETSSFGGDDSTTTTNTSRTKPPTGASTAATTSTTTTTQRTLSPRILLLWRLEELVHDKYHAFLTLYLDRTLRREGLDMARMAALRTAGNLLRSVPQGETFLLSMLVNKLGDPSNKVAAAAAHELRRVIDQHHNMQAIVAREVQQVAHRPHLSPRALYNCITFLNQLRFVHEEEEEDDDNDKAEEKVKEKDDNKKKKKEKSDKDKTQKHSPFSSKRLPASLIKTYFQLFEVAVRRTEAATTTTNHRDKSNGNNNAAATTAMKGRLLSALLTGVNRAHPYLPEKDRELEEHVDALYRIVHTAPPSACTQALMLLYQLAVGSSTPGAAAASPPPSKEKHHPNDKTTTNSKKPGKLLTDQQEARRDRFYRALYASMSQQQPGLLSSGKHLTLYCNLLYKAMKYDTDATRVVAFAKQLLCTTLHSNPPMMAASLFLINEVAKYHSNSSSTNSMSNNRVGTALQECWNGVVLQGREAKALWDSAKREPRGALTWPEDGNIDETTVSKEKDTTKRAGPARAPLWELSLTAHHFHPSVAKFTTSLGDISYSGDPLKDFGLAPFLNKFAYRNPKSMEHLAKHFQRKESVAERKSGVAMDAYLEPPVNDPSFLQRQHVSEQDEFFQKFFAERARRDEIKGIVRKSADDGENEYEEANEAFDAAEANEVDQDVSL